MIKKLTLCLFFLFFTTNSFSYDKINRLGVGLSNQLKNSFPALSFKLQKNRSFAYGGVASYSSSVDNGGYGVGLKLYKNLFDEPQVNFYLAGLGALLSNTVNQVAYSGFQFDLSFGSEFHFQGLSSIGFSFEFGLSVYNNEKFVFQTLGNNFIVSGVHFYL